MSDIADKELGIIYVFTNPAMPGLVKIGKTSRTDIKQRLTELYSTGVPVPFECAYAARVEDVVNIEMAFHQAFGPYRIKAKPEFFHIKAEQAIALISLVAIEDVTFHIQQEANKMDVKPKKRSKQLKARRPSLNFTEMGIPIGSILHFTQSDVSVKVVSYKTVLYDEEAMSLTNVTKMLLNLDVVRPTPYWTYQGKNLADIYEETYEEM